MAALRDTPAGGKWGDNVSLLGDFTTHTFAGKVESLDGNVAGVQQTLLQPLSAELKHPADNV